MSNEIDVEENGRRILEVFAYLDAREGDVLGANNFVAVGRTRLWDMRDLQRGLDHTLANRWVEKVEGGGLRLTKSGSRLVGNFASALSGPS